MSKYSFYPYGSLLEEVFKHVVLWFRMIITKIIITLIGGIFGWLLGLFFGGTILGVLSEIGITGFSMFEIGIFLGFVGSFFSNALNLHYWNKQQQQNQQSMGRFY